VQQVAKEHIRSQALKTFLDKSRSTHLAWRVIPSTYLMCEKDQAIPLAVQEAFVAPDREFWEVERCDADHSPFLSRPQLTANVIRRASGEKI
jgi:hypothetical protein